MMTDAETPASLLQQIARYTEMISRDPSSSVFVQLAEAYRRMDMLDDALQTVEKGLLKNQSVAPGWVAKGRIHVQLGDREKALKAFSQALTIDADLLPALTGLARIQAQLKSYRECRETVRRILSLRPDDPIAKQLESTLPKDTGDVEPVASESAHEKKQPKKDEPFSTGTIAEIYIRQGFLSRALKVYRDILAENPQNDEIRQKLIALKKRINEEDQANNPAGGGPITIPEEIAIAHLAADTAAPEVAQAVPDRVLAVFERWLDFIHRRKHVQ